MKDPKILCEVLGSKYMFLRNNEKPVPKSLYTVTAQLIQHEIICLDDIYIWVSYRNFLEFLILFNLLKLQLTPDDKVMQRECDKAMKDAKEYVRKLQIISINNKETEDTPEEPENPEEKYIHNQKFGLCEALLRIGDWKNAEQVIKQLPEHYAVDQRPIAQAMCNLLHCVVEPVYRE